MCVPNWRSALVAGALSSAAAVATADTLPLPRASRTPLIPFQEVQGLIEPLDRLTPVPQASSAAAADAELVRERYPNGAVKIERYVKQDAEQQ